MNESYKKFNLPYYSLIVLYFFLLLYCLHFFSWSDQYFYQLYYDGLEGRSLLDAYRFYPGIVGAREPVYFMLTYVSQKIMTRQWFDILLSCSFLGVLFLFLHRSKLTKTIMTLILTSIYLFSIFFITERLKLGVVFLLLYFLYSESKYNGVLVLLAILSHAQILILLPFLYTRSRVKINSRKAITLVLLIFMLVAALLFKHMMQKIPYYFHNYSFLNLVKPLVFGFISFTFIKRDHWKQYFSLYIPLLFVALFLGEGRMTLIAFVGCIYFWSIEKKHSIFSILLILSGCYFSLKGFVFLISAKLFGDGYTLDILGVLDYLFNVGGILRN